MTHAFSPVSAVRAMGPVLATARPSGWPTRVAVLAATEVAARRVGRPGFQFVEIAPGPGKEWPPAQTAAAEAAGVAGWVGVTSLLVAVAGRLPIPRPVTGLLLGAAVYVADTQARAAGDRAREAAPAA
jgi:hypothetical protein